MSTLRLILGDQLNASHSWFEKVDDSVVYLIAELKQETSYVKHHAQKVLAFFAAMERFAKVLIKGGHRLEYFDLDATSDYQTIDDLIISVCDMHEIRYFQYQRPDEFRLKIQLENLQLHEVEITCVDSEHFLFPFDEINEYFTAGKATRMETFYRKMRRRFDVLMDGDQPIGGQWNFDQENRNKLKKEDLIDIPEPLRFKNDVSAIIERLKKNDVEHFGTFDELLLWPVTQRQSLELLDYFCQYCLPRFGQFQDSMTTKSPHAWSLYHSRLSFCMNTKMLSPQQVVKRAIKEHKTRPEVIDLAQLEGFVRQIIGWREFVRGIYWINMPDYAGLNALNAKRDLPDFFWTGQTNMHCMRESLGQSLEFAYAHHIQRLMVIGNFCLLAGIDLAQVDEWYLGVYIDAIEWVEMPNTRGMCQYADDGLVASKPYSASGAYINRMSDYCSNCSYSVKEKVTDDACPFNSLYWHFMERHRDKFSGNPRIGMVYRTLDRMDKSLRTETNDHASRLLKYLEKL